MVRLHRLREGNQRQVDGHDPELRQRLLDQQACRLHHLNEAEADPADDRHSLARQPTRLEHRERRRRLLSVLRRHRQNMADHLRPGSVRVRVRLAVLRIFRQVEAGDLKLGEPGFPRQRAPAHMSVAAVNSEHRLEFVSLSPHRLPAGLLVNYAVPEKEGRAPIVNRLASQEVERLLQPSRARDSRSAERRSRREERHHHGHNKSDAMFTAAPGKNSGAAFFA